MLFMHGNIHVDPKSTFISKRSTIWNSKTRNYLLFTIVEVSLHSLISTGLYQDWLLDSSNEWNKSDSVHFLAQQERKMELSLIVTY